MQRPTRIARPALHGLGHVDAVQRATRMARIPLHGFHQVETVQRPTRMARIPLHRFHQVETVQRPTRMARIPLHGFHRSLAVQRIAQAWRPRDAAWEDRTTMRVLVWNLFHGRADPPAGRPLLREFADALAGWEWDVALLQEVPPWWPPLLAGRCGADWRSALTSRNQLLPLRRVMASRAPDRLKSNGGGANAILVRAPWSITAHGRRRLRIRPERRVVHAVRLADPGSGAFDGAWIGNIHTQLGHWSDSAGMAAPLTDLRRATTQLEAWAGDVGDDAAPGGGPGETAPGRGPVGDIGGAGRPPIVLGGDFNLPRDVVATSLPDAWTRIASSGPDHVVGRGVAAASPSVRPERGGLSDHAPLLVDVSIQA